MNGSFDWWGTTAFVAAISILLWLVARSQLPRAVRVASLFVLGGLLAVVLWNIITVLTMAPVARVW